MRAKNLVINPATCITLRQKSMWNGFAWEVMSSTGEVLGHLDFAFFAQAKNARVKLYPDNSRRGDISLTLKQKTYRIRFEHLRRGWTNDVAYTLVDETEEELARIDVLFTNERRLPRLLIRKPFEGEIGITKTMLKKRFVIDGDLGMEIGSVFEPRAFALRRQLDVSLVAQLVPVDTWHKAFIALVVLCTRY
jgi:hypothetical protein